MTAPTVLPPRDVNFSGPPCPRCMLLSIGDHIWPEMVMPLPQGDGVAPLARDGSGPCCFDCASADGLNVVALPGKYEKLQGSDYESRAWFIMARIAVGNDRLEQLRLPGIPMGLVYYGLITPSKPGDLELHLRWLEGLGLRLPWMEDDRG